MPVYVLYGGRLIEKRYRPAPLQHAASDLPAPAINDLPISSSRQREKDLNNSGSYDPRDTPAEFRRAKDGRRKQRERSAAEPS